ncbi:MAG: tetratricopeptide repeat protein [Candidatus Melainabacteria bacterium]|nr:tetratricopeptide repeat protein [Candidatus Melainabacteria bacterium]
MHLPQSKNSICFLLPLLAVWTLSLPVPPAPAQTRPNQKPEQKTEAARATYRIPVKDKYGLPIAQIEYQLKTRNSKGALAALAKVPRSIGDEDRRNMIAGAAKANDNDFDGALPLFSRIKVFEGTPTEYFLAAKTFAIAQDFPKAIEMATRGINLNNDQKCLEIRAGAYSNIGRFDEAIQDYETLARVYPAWTADYLSKEAATLLKLNRFKEALLAAERAIKVNPNEAGAYLMKATALRKLGRLAEAVEASTRSMEAARARLSRNKEAVFLLNRALEERATCYQMLGKRREEAADRDEIKRNSNQVMNELIGR